jgi:predicted dehydrogenase
MAIKIVHFGVGVRGRHWLDIVGQHPDFESVACVDRSEEMLQEARRHSSQRHGNFFTDFRAAVAHARPDAALIATPSALHAEHVIQALDAGLAVLVEKPLAATLADAVRVVQHSRTTTRPVMVAENYRFYRAERTLRQLLASEMAGRIHWATCADRRDQPSHSQGPWVKAMAHPYLTEIAVHYFDSFRFLFARRPAAISALSYNVPASGYEREAGASVVIELEDGPLIQFGGSMASSRYEFGLWVEGEKGDLWTDRNRVWWRSRGSRFFRPCRSVAVPKGDELPYPKAGTVSLLNQFRDAALHGRVPETSAEDNLWTLAMVEASILSHREGRRVPIAEVFTAELRRQAGIALA